MELIIGLVACALCALAGFWVGGFVRKTAAQQGEDLAARLIEENERRFAQVSMEALSRSSEQLVRLASERLEGERRAGVQELDSRKGLIDVQLQRLNTELEKVTQTVQDLEKDREQKFGQLATQLRMTAEQTSALRETTGSLKEALASVRVRGSWGERMVEDILRLSGMLENVNYRKQQTLETGGRPDFTFLMPRQLELNLDSKFPLDNYIRAVEAQSAKESETYKKAFLKDVREKVRECATKDYIHEGTVDYVLLFIPNESLYAYIHEADGRIQDEALASRVVLCSPLTLYAVLSVIRQAIDNFSLERKSRQILELLGGFRGQWQKFVEGMDRLGRRIGDAQKEFDALSTTRRRMLEQRLNEIDDLKIGDPAAVAAAVDGGREPLSVLSSSD